MSGQVAIIMRIMPSSPQDDLEEMKKNVIEKLSAEGAQNISFEEHPVAFGLKALMLKMAWPEEKGTEMVEEIVQKIENVSSTKIEDYRRAFG